MAEDDDPEGEAPEGEAPQAEDSHADDPERQRLDELGKTIATAREHAEDAIPVLEDDEQRFMDSGDTPRQDDQTAPPA